MFLTRLIMPRNSQGTCPVSSRYYQLGVRLLKSQHSLEGILKAYLPWSGVLL